MKRIELEINEAVRSEILNQEDNVFFIKIEESIEGRVVAVISPATDSGNLHWIVDKSHWGVNRYNRYTLSDLIRIIESGNYKAFENKSDAKKWAKLNQPQYTEKQVRDYVKYIHNGGDVGIGDFIDKSKESDE